MNDCAFSEMRGIPTLAESRVSRLRGSPAKVNPHDESFSADLNDLSSVRKAVDGSEAVYRTAGLPYRVKIWEQQWPQIMENVIKACGEADTRLIFFDDVYMYGLVKGEMTEATPHAPVSRKGMVRACIAERLSKAWEEGSLQGAIVRCPDFYGPGATNSVFKLMVLDRFKNGKRALWIGDDSVQYRMAHTADAARATALVGNTPSAWQQVWHVPVPADRVTSGDLIKLAAEIAGVKARYTVLKKWMLKGIGWFDPTIGEIPEMLYQYDRNYLFNSSKFARRFQYQAIPYREGFREVMKD